MSITAMTVNAADVGGQLRDSRESVYTVSTSSVGGADQVYTSSTTVCFVDCSADHRHHSVGHLQETKFGRMQLKLRAFINHLAFRIFSFCLILADTTVLILDFARSTTSMSVAEQMTYDIMAITFVSYFFLEVNLRLVALGCVKFVKMWYNVVDYLVVVVSFVVTILYSGVVGINISEYTKLVVVGRLVRVTIFIRLFTERKQLEAGMRQMVSQNKRRYQKDGFDLDLTYVTDRIIAMSFPSSGKEAMYRNPIKEVARFLDTKHSGHYKVYNLCSEKSYNTKYFHRRVEHFPFDDHNPPRLRQMFDFTKNVRTWLDSNPRNVIAVHCKGGKGRTGTMVSVWLIDSGQFDSALASLDYFGTRRTNLALGNKFQGVETPSQNRYVGYFSDLKDNRGGQMPSDVTLRLDRVKMCSIKSVGKGDGSDFTIEIQNGLRHKYFAFNFSKSSASRRVYFSLYEDCVELRMQSGPIMSSDAKVIFHCSSETVPREEGDVAFFFWFHTSFVVNHKLVLRRDELDGAHKAKRWSTFNEYFAIELCFSDVKTIN